MEQLNLLREHNKDLVKQLKREKRAFERLGGRYNAGAMRAEFQVLTGEELSSAGATSAKPSVRFADTVCEHEVSPPSLTTEQRQGSARCSKSSDFFTKRRSIHDDRSQDEEQTGVWPFTENQEKKMRGVSPGVSFSECAGLLASARHHLPPLLGYDWIAGVLDIDDSVIERSDEFFSDLHSFRSLNKSECVHSSRTELSETPLGLSALNDEGDPEVNLDTHQCAFWYRMNSRLFPVSLHAECCLVCKKHKASHPHTLTNPALIRVSIPRAAVLPPYKFRAHRRRSFDTSDGLGLPSHCLAGWSNRSQNTLAAPSSLDLRSNMNVKEGFSKRRAPNHQVRVSASGLAPHNFQHSPKKKKARRHFCTAPVTTAPSRGFPFSTSAI